MGCTVCFHEIIEQYFDLYGSSSEMSGLEDAYEYIQTPEYIDGRIAQMQDIDWGDYND